MAFQIPLNFEGNDYIVEVDDVETANLIMNDADAAYRFLLTNYPQLAPGGSRSQEEDPPSTSLNEQNEEVWIKKKPTQRDLEATAFMLSLRQQKENQFRDKKTPKSRLWQKVSEEMKNMGFRLGDNAAEKFRQKFANLTKTYMNYVKHQKTTGQGATDPPPFFDELHSLLGTKHKIAPQHIEDTLQMDVENVPVEDENIPIQETPRSSQGDGESITNRFLKSRKNVRPESKTDLILQEIRRGNDMKVKQFDFFKNHLTKTEEQTERFLKIMEDAFPKRKRKREDSDEDD